MNTNDDIVRFYNERSEYVNEFIVDGEKYSILSDGQGMELFFYGDSEKVWLNYCEPYYKPKNSMKAIGQKWIRPNGDSGINYLQVELTDLDIPCNVCVPDFYRQKHVNATTVQKMDIICFMDSMTVYKTQKEYQNNDKGFASELLIPCGTFSARNEKDIEPNNTIILNGKIAWIEEKFNDIGGGEYYHVGVNCLGTVFEIVVEEDYDISLAVGDIFHGVFKLVGKIME